jgi:hypothetical protein
MRTTLILSFFVSALAAGAQEPPAAPARPDDGQRMNIERIGAMFVEGRFRSLDKDHDGKLSAEEAKPAEIFIKGADADGDGFYTLEEVQAHMRNRPAS